MRSAILLFLIFCSVTINAIEKLKISISLQDSATHTLISYASVTYRLDTDTTYIAGCSEKNGNYILWVDKTGKYALRVGVIGYRQLDTLLNISTNAHQQAYKLLLRPSIKLLKEVTISGVRKAYEQKYDRKVFSITEAQMSTARTVLDLLKTLPGVVVNEDDKTIIYRGQSPTMQVNNIPANFLYPNLSMIMAEKVKKIELIDPSSRGGGVSGGIINIVLISNRKDDINGFWSSEMKHTEEKNTLRQNHSFNINYGVGNNTFYANIDFSDGNKYNINDKKGYAENTQIGKENIIQIDTTTLKNSIQSTFSIGNMKSIDSLKTYYYGVSGILDPPNNTLKNSFVLRGKTTFNINESKSLNMYAFGAFYAQVRKFKKPDKELDWHIGVNPSIKMRIYSETKYTYPVSPTLNISSNDISNEHQAYTSVFFNNPLDNGWNSSLTLVAFCGFPTSYSDRWKNQKLDTLNLTKDKRTRILGYSTINLGKRIKQVRIQGGLTLNYNFNEHEYLRYLAAGKDTLFSLKRHFLSPSPNITLNWYSSDINDFSLKYSYSLESPDIDNFTNYIDKSGIYTWTTGNPNLQPAYYHSFALGHTYTQKKFNLSTEIIYKESGNGVVTIGYYLPNNIILIKPENVGRTQEVNLMFTNWISLTSKLSMTNSANLNYKQFDQSNLKNVAQAFGLDGNKLIYTQFGYDVGTYMTWKLNKRSFASLMLRYYSRSLRFNGYVNPWLSSSVNYTCKLLKNDKLKLIIGIDNLTAGLIKRISVNNNMGTYTTTYEYPSSYLRTYKLSFTYMFNKGTRGTDRKF